MNLRTPLAGAMLALISAIAAAQAPAASTATPRIDARGARQEQRIEQGKATGALTPHETRRLKREQKGIARAETQAKADGTVTAQERQRLTRMQNKASRDIHRQKHDAPTVPATK